MNMLHIGVILLTVLLVLMNLDLRKENKKLRKRLSDIEKSKRLAMNKRMILSAKSDFESQL